MQIKDLKEICKLVGCNGIIDEFIINKDGHVKAADIERTFVTDLQYNIKLMDDIHISGISGINEILDKFTDDTEIKILNNAKLYLEKEGKFANIVLKNNPEETFKIPEMTEDDYTVIMENIDHNLINLLGNLRPKILNENYHLYVEDNKLIFRVGEVDETNLGNIIGIPRKSTPGTTMFVTRNVSQCFKNITNTANIILTRDLMIVECNTEKYNVKYYLAPRVD